MAAECCKVTNDQHLKSSQPVVCNQTKTHLWACYRFPASSRAHAELYMFSHSTEPSWQDKQCEPQRPVKLRNFGCKSSGLAPRALWTLRFTIKWNKINRTGKSDVFFPLLKQWALAEEFSRSPVFFVVLEPAVIYASKYATDKMNALKKAIKIDWQ